MFLTFLASVLSTAVFSQESLDFTGSFWDTADSFRFSIALEEKSVRLRWNGYAENRMSRKKDSSGRISYQLDCTQAESEAMRLLVNEFQLCHPGFLMMIGTGLSVSAAKFHEGSLEYDYSYFSVQDGNHLGKRAENFPLLFQRLIGDGDFSDEDRSKFFGEVRSFSQFLSAYRKALESLAECQELKSPVPWKTVLSFLEWQEAEEESESEVGTEALMEARSIVSAMLGGPGLEEYFPKGVPGETLVMLDGLFATASTGEYTYPLSVAVKGLSGDPESFWIPYPRYLKGLLEDFIHGRWSMGDVAREVEHPYLDISLFGDTAEQAAIRKRFRFIEDSGYLDFFLLNKKIAVTDPGVLRINSMTLSKDRKQAVVEIHGIERSHTILEKEASGWKVKQLLDHEEFLGF